MREIDTKDITAAVKKLCMDANFFLGKDVLAAFEKFKKEEESPIGKHIL